MPTRANGPRFCNLLYQDSRSWTDDIPVCKESGIGLSTNQVYREDGHRQEEHSFEDQSFHFKYDDCTYMYGVFDGNDSAEAAKFALDNIAAEVLLGQLNDKNTDEEIKQVLRNAFITVERSYMNSVGDKLAERASLQMEIPEDLTSYEMYQKFPHLVDKLDSLNAELSCGTTAVVALIHKGRLYVANVGNSRALLCRTDSDGVLRVIQLSVDHDLSNEDELLRLSLLRLPTDKFRKGFRIGNQEYTRCLGNYSVKGGYKDFDDVADATSEPVIPDPDITGGIELDKSCRFLMLMSDGLYKSLEQATGTQNVNKELAQMAVEQFKVQSTLTGVAQAIVDKVVIIHHDVYMNRSGTDQIEVSKRDDITLVIRNFNFPMPNAISPIPGPAVSFRLPVLNNWRKNHATAHKGDSSGSVATNEVTSNDSEETSYTDSSKELLSNDHIKPYVDFSEYYANIEKARNEGTLPDGIEWL